MTITEELIKCRKWIQLALDKGGDTHDFVDIVDGVISGHMQLWSGERGCGGGWQAGQGCCEQGEWGTEVEDAAEGVRILTRLGMPLPFKRAAYILLRGHGRISRTWHSGWLAAPAAIPISTAGTST